MVQRFLKYFFLLFLLFFLSWSSWMESTAILFNPYRKTGLWIFRFFLSFFFFSYNFYFVVKSILPISHVLEFLSLFLFFVFQIFFINFLFPIFFLNLFIVREHDELRRRASNLTNDVLIALLFCHAPGLLSAVMGRYVLTLARILCCVWTVYIFFCVQ